MLTHKVRLQVIAFMAIGLVAMGYLGTRYAGLGDLFGNSGYQVHVALPSGGGVFTNAEVTYRGVPVGRVGDLTLTRDGILATLKIDSGAPKIPSDLEVKVANRSVIGEQYVDLRPISTGEPFLTADDRILGSQKSLPPDVNELLRHSSEFAGSLPPDALRTVVNEVYDASQGAGPNLRVLLSAAKDLSKKADANFVPTASLIKVSGPVLATQEESARSILSFSKSLHLLANTLKTSDPALRKLIASAPAAAIQLDELITSVGVPLGVLMSNLTSTAQVFGTNASAVADTLFRLPEAVSVGWDINKSGTLQLGLTQTFFDPLPCTTGYGGTQLRPGLDTTPGKPVNLSAGCTAAPSSGTNVRGPQSVPAPDVPVDSARITVPNTLADLLGGSQ